MTSCAAPAVRCAADRSGPDAAGPLRPDIDARLRALAAYLRAARGRTLPPRRPADAADLRPA